MQLQPAPKPIAESKAYLVFYATTMPSGKQEFLEPIEHYCSSYADAEDSAQACYQPTMIVSAGTSRPSNIQLMIEWLKNPSQVGFVFNNEETLSRDGELGGFAWASASDNLPYLGEEPLYGDLHGLAMCIMWDVGELNSSNYADADSQKVIADWMGINEWELEALCEGYFFDEGESHSVPLADITVADAITCLEHFLATGRIEWNVACWGDHA